MGKLTRKRTPPEKRFMRYINKTEKCWLWTGGNNGKYGVFYVGPDASPMRMYAHRWSYVHFVGLIPEGLEVNHRCEVPLCVRPDHLEPLTHRDNTLYGNAPAARKARQTHCVNNHEFTPENTYIRSNGTRACKTCRRVRMAELRASRTR